MKRQSRLKQTTVNIHCFFKIIRLEISCKFSARQRIHMKYQPLFSSKDKSRKIKVSTAICVWHFKLDLFPGTSQDAPLLLN